MPQPPKHAKGANTTAHTPGTPHNLAQGLDEELSDMMDDDTTSLCDRQDELEKQLQAYKDMMEELLNEKAAYSSSSSATSGQAERLNLQPAHRNARPELPQKAKDTRSGLWTYQPAVP